MKGISFDGLHSYRDFSLVLAPKAIGSPQVKRYQIEVPGADGTLDLTDFFGEPKFENVTHTFEFSLPVPQTELLYTYQSIKNAIHGKKMRIILDDDPLFYYIGRCEVSPLTQEKTIGKLSIVCDCDPYKYRTQKTVFKIDVTGEFTTTIPNSRKRVVPEVQIVTDGSIRIVYQNNIWDLGSGSYILPELELVEGNNEVSVTGTGSVILTYREGAL